MRTRTLSLIILAPLSALALLVIAFLNSIYWDGREAILFSMRVVDDKGNAVAGLEVFDPYYPEVPVMMGTTDEDGYLYTIGFMHVGGHGILSRTLRRPQPRMIVEPAFMNRQTSNESTKQIKGQHVKNDKAAMVPAVGRFVQVEDPSLWVESPDVAAVTVSSATSAEVVPSSGSGNK